jgi:hypothetical protein
MPGKLDNSDGFNERVIEKRVAVTSGGTGSDKNRTRSRKTPYSSTNTYGIRKAMKGPDVAYPRHRESHPFSNFAGRGGLGQAWFSRSACQALLRASEE